MLKVGLTGGIASGKSTVTAMLAGHGARLVDVDALARGLLEPGSPILPKVLEAFGPEAEAPGGGLDRAALRKIIFKDQAQRRRLNALVHPEVGRLVRCELERLEQTGPAVVVVDAPLLFEAGNAETYHCTILVWASRQAQLQRLIERDGVDRASARAALAAQMPLEDKVQLVDFLVDNSGSVEETRFQVRKLWTTLFKLAAVDNPRE